MTHNEYTNFLFGILIGAAIGLSVGKHELLKLRNIMQNALIADLVLKCNCKENYHIFVVLAEED